MVELIAPRIGGVALSDGTAVAARQMIDGGPSVLYDAVAVLASVEGAAMLALDAAAKDFVTDAHAHCKLIGHVGSASGLLEAAGVAEMIDDGYVALDGGDAHSFIVACRQVRCWDREDKVHAH